MKERLRVRVSNIVRERKRETKDLKNSLMQKKKIMR